MSNSGGKTISGMYFLWLLEKGTAKFYSVQYQTSANCVK